MLRKSIEKIENGNCQSKNRAHPINLEIEYLKMEVYC